MKLIDAHCHLTDEAYDKDRDFLIKDLENFCIDKVIVPAVNMEDSYQTVKLAEKYDKLYAQVGIHPEDADSFEDSYLEEIEKLSKNKKVIGIGEIGLDFCRRKDNRKKQEEAFIKQLDLARKLKLPVTIHSRDAKDAVFEILKSYKDLKVHIHCFSDDIETMYAYVDFGFYISIPGVVTYKNSKELQEIATKIPLDRLMIETDGPYLTPAPYRGSRNDPRKVVEVARTIADLRGMKIEKLAKHSKKNTEKFFDLEV